MAAIAGPGICENRDRPMSRKLTAAAPSVASGKVPAPVRVRLKRVNCDQAIPYPPDGQTREWWHRLKNAFGTTSSAFVDASLYQLIAAARLPNSGICEIAVNASLAFIEGAKPRDEIECALVIQMLSPGAPRGSRNGNYRRGDWTTEAIEERRWLRSLVRNFAKTEAGR